MRSLARLFSLCLAFFAVNACNTTPQAALDQPLSLSSADDRCWANQPKSVCESKLYGMCKSNDYDYCYGACFRFYEDAAVCKRFGCLPETTYDEDGDPYLQCEPKEGREGTVLGADPCRSTTSQASCNAIPLCKWTNNGVCAHKCILIENNPSDCKALGCLYDPNRNFCWPNI